MSTGRTSPRGFAAGLALLIVAGLPASLAGQLGPQTAPLNHQRPDFMFGRPHVSVGFRGGYAMPSAGPSDVYDQLSADQALILYAKNFNSAAVTGELAVRATDRLDLLMDLGYAVGKVRSEYKEWVDNNNLPIQQTTRLTRKPLTFGVKAYLWNPGRAIGQLAWIPARWDPFVGAGVGWVWYHFVQSGDFIDFQTNDVYRDRLESSAKTGTVHVFGGADWSLSPHFVLTAEGRYAWAHAPMGQDFVGFRKIDLSGFQASAGISLRF